jgi:hypothetical protein
MEQTRRGFIQRTLMALGALAISGTTMFLTACGNVANSIITAFQGILKILAQAGVITNQPLIVAVTSALNAVLGAVTAYANAPAADKTTFGLQLALAIQLAQAQLQAFWSSLNLTGTVAIVVEGLVTILLSTLASFLPSLPAVAMTKELREAKALPKQIAYHPQQRSDKQFRKDVNAVCVANGMAKIFQEG